MNADHNIEGHEALAASSIGQYEQSVRAFAGLIDEILDVARKKGTGMWTSQSAMELHVPIPTINQG